MPLPSTYNSQEIEPKWISLWHDKKLFLFDSTSKKPSFSIPIPPPNVTGALHMGHALVNTLQDVLLRWKKMTGHEVFWALGTDHAGIATQTVVEKNLRETTKKRRHEIGRKAFVAECWKWKEEREKVILGQLKRLGTSGNFEQVRFTMDEGCNRAVKVAFKKLYDKGLIYRGDYLVNWDPISETALSDDEVEFEERPSFLWFFRYPVEGGGEIKVATTRPETILGDTAVAVNPKDDRYSSFIGKNVLHPLTGRIIPIIADDFVDPLFGTGAVKITPAHDPNDYEVALRHSLPFINLLCPNGTVNENGGAFQGISFQDCREKVVEAMTKESFFLKKEPHVLRVGVSYRSKAIIEPYLSKQWFLKMTLFKDRLREIVAEKECSLIPEGWEKTYFHWIDGLRDWCISRQLWWGHQIPVFTNKKDPAKVLCLDDEKEMAALSLEEWSQDPDVLDTWFSSALWPFSVLGWPEKSDLLTKCYPQSLLVTGHDILFFWVARMLFMGDELTGKIPFPKVFLHGLIFGKSYYRMTETGISYVSAAERKAYDLGAPLPPGVSSKWEKMSKSKGNVIDPLEIIDEFGTDALRMTLCSMGTRLRECDLDRRKFEDFRNFANKLWNGARFVLMQTEELSAELLSIPLEDKDLLLEDRWILTKLNDTIREINSSLDNYNFAEAAGSAYTFFWDPLCSWYLEISKPILFGKRGTPQERAQKQKLLLFLLLKSVQLLHPMAPFITDEIFSFIKEQLPATLLKSDIYLQELLQAKTADSLYQTSFPDPQTFSFSEETVKDDFKKIEQVLYCLRNMRGEVGLPLQEALEVYIESNDPVLLKNSPLIGSLIKIKSLHFGPCLAPFKSTKEVAGCPVSLVLTEEFRQKEMARLTKEKTKTEELLRKATLLSENPAFMASAPPETVKKNEEERLRLSSRLQELQSSFERLSS